MHTYDAQTTVGAPQPLPTETALDGVDEFLSTCCAGPYPWPFGPSAVEYHAAEGGAWLLSLTPEGVRVTRPAVPDITADASLRGTASDLVLALYGRVSVDSLKLDGDQRVFDQLLAWDPDE